MDAGAFLAPLIPPWSPSTAAPSTALAEHLHDLLGAANDSLKVVLKPSSALESLAPTMAAPTSSWPPSDDALVNFTLDAAAANLTLNGTPSDDDLDVQEFIFNNLGPQRLPYRTSLTVVYVLIAVAGLVGNVLTCLVVLRNLSMRTSTNYYLVNLAVADIITLLFALPMEVYHMWLQYPWILGDVLCRVRAIVPETLAHVSVLTILAVSGERYVAITDPVLARTTHTLSRTARVVPIIWLVALLAATPWGYYHQSLCCHLSLSWSFDWFFYWLTMPDCGIIEASSASASMDYETSTFLNFAQKVIKCRSDFLRHLRVTHSPRRVSDCASGRKPALALLSLWDPLYKPSLFFMTLIVAGIVLSIDPPSRTPSAGNGAMHTRRLGIRMLVAVVVVFFLCWAPFHAQRLMFVIVTSYGEWTPHLRTVNANLYYFTGIFQVINEIKTQRKETLTVTKECVWSSCTANCLAVFLVYAAHALASPHSPTVAVVVVFFLCWAPFHAQRLMFVIVTSYGEWTPHLRTVNANLYYFTGLCYYLNSAVNPVLYSIMSVRFRIAFRRSLCGGKEWARRQLYISNTYGPQIASNHSNFLNRTREVSTASTKFVTRVADPKRQLEPPNRNGFTYAYEPMDLEG
ncbi:pyrokinin-1 receptor-like [Penaeus indicus]|uniref:pyrokinin-1 receptor-like n=1 Tax=Penaeus indicus TaxID=29960 RepID=UPI00300D026C